MPGVTDPNSWEGSFSEVPPHNWQQVLPDSRFWWTAPPGQSMGSDGDISYFFPPQAPIPNPLFINWEIVEPPEGAFHIRLTVNFVEYDLGTSVGSGVQEIDSTGFDAVIIGFPVGLGTTYDAVVALTVSGTPPAPISGKGDITNPFAWSNSTPDLTVGAITQILGKGDVTNPFAWAVVSPPDVLILTVDSDLFPNWIPNWTGAHFGDSETIDHFEVWRKAGPPTIFAPPPEAELSLLTSVSGVTFSYLDVTSNGNITNYAYQVRMFGSLGSEVRSNIVVTSPPT